MQMKVLMIADVQGHLGDAIRIQKNAETIKKKHDLLLVNAADYHRPSTKLLQHPSVLASAAFGFLKSPDTAVLEAYGVLLQKILRQTLQNFRADVVVVEGIVQAGLLADHCEVPLIADVHGLASAEYAENPFHRVRPARTRFLEKLEKIAFKKSAQLWLVSAPMLDHAVRHGASRDNCVLVRNGADVQSKKARYANTFNVAYGGIFAFWEDVDSFLDLAKKGGANYHLAGGGPLKRHVENRLNKEKIALTYYGSLNRIKSLDFFTKMQVGVAPSVDALTRRVASPIKVFDYLACGLPVITPDVGEWADIVQAQDAGVVTEKSSGEAFFAALHELQDKKIWLEKSSNALRAIRETYHWQKVLAPIHTSLNAAVL
jgi:glycosyltransferase involved in cell wall biosynthesis